MANDKDGFPAVKVNNVQISKATTTDGKCQITLTLDVDSEGACQLTDFAYRKANLRMQLIEIDPELPNSK